ncbi:MAG: GlsB/YeaQ/YmgE family stress response membrane protein [Bacillota bacterium]|nr:GlsB/YeaQ/YmgE family stress response membrane protein [Bacillota bacterium]
MNILSLIIWLAVGALIGFIAGKIMKSKSGLIGNIIIGIVGSALGGWLAGLLGIGGAGFSLGGLLVSIGGACLLIFLARLIFK